MKLKKKFKSTGKLYICSLGVHHVAVEGNNKTIPKDVKEYLSEELDRIIEIRKTMGKDQKVL